MFLALLNPVCTRFGAELRSGSTAGSLGTHQGQQCCHGAAITVLAGSIAISLYDKTENRQACFGIQNMNCFSAVFTFLHEDTWLNLIPLKQIGVQAQQLICALKSICLPNQTHCFFFPQAKFRPRKLQPFIHRGRGWLFPSRRCSDSQTCLLLLTAALCSQLAVVWKSQLPHAAPLSTDGASK